MELKCQEADVREQELAASVAAPLEKVDRITMYGDGNAAKLVGDITQSTTQITEGLTQGFGIDIKSLLAGALGAKLLSDRSDEENDKEK